LDFLFGKKKEEAKPKSSTEQPFPSVKKVTSPIGSAIGMTGGNKENLAPASQLAASQIHEKA
jgi:hypothetical protein